MSRSLKSILYDAATSLLESRDRVEARDEVRKARMLHADVFEREQEAWSWRRLAGSRRRS